MDVAPSEAQAQVERLKERYARYCDLLQLAEEYFAMGNYPASAALAQIAARSAFPDHIGLFGSPRLERILVRLGKQIQTSATRRPARDNGVRRNVLHVMTYAKPVGGDGRFVWRWMLADRANRHSVAITTQSHYKGVFEVPEYLRHAAEGSGGLLHAIRASASKPLEQARELRALCQEQDLVALHLWPYDIVPVQPWRPIATRRERFS